MIPSPLNTPGYRYATRKFTGDGVTTDYEFSFAGVEPGYISRDHVTVSIMDNANRVEVELPKELITWMGVNQLRLHQPYSEDFTIIIRRDTPKDKPLLDFNDGAILNEYNLNMTSQQAVYVAAEMVDRFADLIDLFMGVNQDVIDALDFAIQAYNMALIALNRANEAWDLANSKPDNFLELDDTPNTYSGEAGNVVIVNPVEDGLDMVPIDEVPGFRDAVDDIIDDRGPGDGDGIPLTAPVLLHQDDPSVPNGARLVPGSNVNLTYNIDGDLVVSSTGGGGGSINGYGFVDGGPVGPSGTHVGTWVGTNGHNAPLEGTQGFDDSITIGNFNGTDKKIQIGIFNKPGWNWLGFLGDRVSIGYFDYGDLGRDTITGLTVGDSILIGEDINRGNNGGPGNISLGYKFSPDYEASGSIHLYTEGYPYRLKQQQTGHLRGSVGFGGVDLGGLPGAFGFPSMGGSGSRVFFGAGLGVDPSDVVDPYPSRLFAAIGSLASPLEQEYTGHVSSLRFDLLAGDGIGKTYTGLINNLFHFNGIVSIRRTHIPSDESRLSVFKIEALVQKTSSSINILSLEREAIHEQTGDGFNENSVDLVVNNGELKLSCGTPEDFEITYSARFERNIL